MSPAEFPELRLLDSDEAGRAAIAEVERRVSRKTRLVLGVDLVVYILLASCARATLHSSTSSFWVELSAAGVIAAITSLPTWLVLRKRRPSELRHYLRERGIPVCLHCGYSLRGLTEPRCPECGREFEPYLLALGNREGNQQDAKRAKAAEQSDS